MRFDNQTTIYIVSNLEFHEQTKHIMVDCCVLRDDVMSKKIYTLLEKIN